jgi:hypothetical protein
VATSVSEPFDNTPRRGDHDVAEFAPRRVSPGARSPGRTLLLVMAGLAVLETVLIAGSLLPSLGSVEIASPPVGSASHGPGDCPTADTAPRGPLPRIVDQPIDRAFLWIGDGGIIIGSLAGEPERPLGVSVLRFDVRVARLSPSGNAVAFDAVRELQCGDVYVVRVADSTVVRLSDGAADTIARAPAWSPDGGSLAYLSYRSAGLLSTADVHLATAATGTDAVVASVPACRIDGTLSFSPDGRRLAVDCGPAIVVIDLQTNAISRAASGTGVESLLGGAFLRLIDATTMQTLQFVQLPTTADVAAALGLDAARIDVGGGPWTSTELAPDGSIIVATVSVQVCPESGCTEDAPTTGRSILFAIDATSWDRRLLALVDGWVDRVVVTPENTIIFTGYSPGDLLGTFAVDLANPTPRRISDRTDRLASWNGGP